MRHYTATDYKGSPKYYYNTIPTRNIIQGKGQHPFDAGKPHTDQSNTHLAQKYGYYDRSGNYPFFEHGKQDHKQENVLPQRTHQDGDPHMYFFPPYYNYYYQKQEPVQPGFMPKPKKEKQKKIPLCVQFMNMYGLGDGLDETDRDSNIVKHIRLLGGIEKTVPEMKSSLLENEL